MWRKQQKEIADERIVKESNRLSVGMYYVITLLTILSLVVKMIYKLPIYVYGLEIICLIASNIYLLVSEMKKGILFVRKKDEELLSIHHGILARAEMITFWIIIVGELLFLFLAKEYSIWALSYLVIWFIPAIITTFMSIKNGWLIWGSKKREIDGKKNLKKRVAYGAIFFGLFVGFPFLYHDGVFHIEGILWILGLAAGWGIPFYFLFTALMGKSEKMADKKLEEKEVGIEE